MSDWILISLAFGALALLACVYEPKTLVEHEDGSLTYEHTKDDKPTLLERARVIFAIAVAWAIVMMIDYHEQVLVLVQEYLNFKF